MICMIIIFFLLAPTLSLKEKHTELEYFEDDAEGEYILCRYCGSDISSSNYLVSVRSPVSRHAFNDTLFGKEQVLVQLLSNDLIFNFPLITTSHSNCVSVGEWEEHETWFPGYRWKVCVCPDCGEYKGWVFEPVLNKKSKKPFYGLLLSTLIGEYFADLLTKYPIIERSN